MILAGDKDFLSLEMERLRYSDRGTLFREEGVGRLNHLNLCGQNKKGATKVDFEGNKIHICSNVLYSADRGIYEDSPKTATSNRFVTLPLETLKLLRKYCMEEADQRTADILADVFLKKA